MAVGIMATATAEVVLAAATVLAVAAVAVALPAVLRAPRDRAARTRLTPALVILTGGAVISFAAYLAYTSRCGHRCERGAGTGFAGLHDWWRTRHSWQWHAQLVIAGVALAAGALAFALAAYGMRLARVPLSIARLLLTAWAIVCFAMPAVYELLTA
jgi:hypothetical protein